MVSIRVLILSACLVSASYGKAAFGLGGITGGLTGGLGGTAGIVGGLEKGVDGGANHGGSGGGGHAGGIGELVKGVADIGGNLLGGGGSGSAGGLLPGGPLGAIAGILKDLEGGVGGSLGGVGAVLHDLLSLKIPSTVEDLFNIVGIVVKAVSQIVSQIWPGLGKLLGSIAGTIVRIVTCLLGSKGPANLHCGDLTGASGHGQGHHGSDGVDLSQYADQLGISRLVKEIEDFVSNILGGRDISELPKSQAVVLQTLQKLAKLLQKKHFSKKDVTSYIALSITIVASISNGKSSKSGDELVKHLVGILDPVLKKSGFTSLSEELNEILKSLEGTSDNSGSWNKSSEGSDSQNASQNHGDNSSSNGGSGNGDEEADINGENSSNQNNGGSSDIQSSFSHKEGRSQIDGQIKKKSHHSDESSSD